MEQEGRPWDRDWAPPKAVPSDLGGAFSSLLEEAIETAERRLDAERKGAARRAVQLAREQAYHRLAVALDRPAKRSVNPGQLSLFVVEDTLFDDAG